LERLATAFSEFAKLPEPVLAPVDINKIIKEVAELFQASLEAGRVAAGESRLEGAHAASVDHRLEGAGQGAQESPEEDQRWTSPVRIELLLDSSLPSVSADAQQIRMAFLNIVKNAVEAMPEGGTLKISSQRAGTIESQSISGPRSGEATREFVEIAFKDTGCGIPEALIGKVMTPHFTTKKGGTGLGLAVVSKIVSQHGGRVFIQSRETTGTLVRIVLPAQSSGWRTVS
jgi:signal transduction histidine kinase